MAASGPGGGRGGGEGEVRRRAEDCEDGRGRPCALQRQVPAVLRVRSGHASASVQFVFRGWDFLSSCDAETSAHIAHSTVRCSS